MLEYHHMGKFSLEKPPNQKEIPKQMLPEDFTLPDLSPVSAETDPESPYFRKTEKIFELQHAGQVLECKCMFERDAPRNKNHTEYPVMLTVQAGEKGKYDPTFKFKGPLIFGKLDKHSEKDDKFWYILYRRVEEKSQGKGFGKIALQLYEEIVEKIQKEYPELRADSIRIDTGLSSMAGLAVSQGYEPINATEEDIQRLLDEGTTDLKQLTGDREKVVLVKHLSD